MKSDFDILKLSTNGSKTNKQINKSLKMNQPRKDIWCDT